MPTVRWQPDRVIPPPPWPVPPLPLTMKRGLTGRCPGCGEGSLFRGFLKVTPVCPNCRAPLGLARADDAPPYFSILITGHIVVPSILLLQRVTALSDWDLAAIFLPLTAALSIALLRPVKGVLVGMMLSLGMLNPDPKPE